MKAGKFLLPIIIATFVVAFFSIFVVVTALYLPLLPPEILASRVGNPSSTEVIMGSILIILTLEAARRSIGYTLPLICIIFMILILGA